MPITKAHLRAEVAARFSNLDEFARIREECCLHGLLCDFLSRPGFGDSPILAYYPLPDEPALLPALYEIARHRPFCLPRMLSDGTIEARLIRDFNPNAPDLVRGPFDVYEPSLCCPVLAPQELGVILVPGRAFTLTGGRLGRGKGFYDRFLARTDAYKIAPALRCQIFSMLPMQNHDQPVDQVLVAE